MSSNFFQKSKSCLICYFLITVTNCNDSKIADTKNNHNKGSMNEIRIEIEASSEKDRAKIQKGIDILKKSCVPLLNVWPDVEGAKASLSRVWDTSTWAKYLGWGESVDIDIKIKRDGVKHKEILHANAIGHTLHYKIGAGRRPGISCAKPQCCSLCSTNSDDHWKGAPMASEIGLSDKPATLEEQGVNAQPDEPDETTQSDNPPPSKEISQKAKVVFQGVKDLMKYSKKLTPLRESEMPSVHTKCVRLMMIYQSRVEAIRKLADQLPSDRYGDLKTAANHMITCLTCLKGDMVENSCKAASESFRLAQKK